MHFTYSCMVKLLPLNSQIYDTEFCIWNSSERSFYRLILFFFSRLKEITSEFFFLFLTSMHIISKPRAFSSKCDCLHYTIHLFCSGRNKNKSIQQHLQGQSSESTQCQPQWVTLWFVWIHNQNPKRPLWDNAVFLPM